MTDNNILANHTYENAMNVLNQAFYRILDVNLTQNTFRSVIDVTPYGASDPEHFSAMVRKFAQEGNVHEEDLDKYYSQTTPEHIRDWLQKGNTGELLVYRRKVEDAYRWTAIEIWPGEDSADGEEHITVMVRDVHQAYNRQLTQRQQVEQFAMTDPMTGLRNRLAYTKCCQDYADRLNRHSVGIIFADVNGLKFVNDNYGHQNGDEYLLTFATELQNLYGCEHCYRLSGDEFLVVMEHYTKIHFAELFAKLQEFLWSQPSPMASVGACWEEAPADIEHLVQKAERVMYSDKQYYYQKYHHTTRENLGNYNAMEFSIEQILSAHAEETAAAGQEQLDTTGLSSHIFDVFAGTTKRSYLFLENLETRVSRWSKKAVEDFELPGEYVYDVNGVWLERVHPEDRAHYMQEVNDLFTGRKSRFNLNYRARNAQGKYVVCAGEACMIRGQGDKPDYFAGTITNYGIPDTVDRVTNLPSETAFLQRLHEMTEDETTSTVMMVVIDMFSSINGLYGMQTGEEILRIFGENLQRLVGDAGQVYHLQGAVFCICMEDMNQEATLQLYHEIQQMGYHRISFGDLEVTLRTLGSATIFGFAPNEAERISSNLSHVIGESRELYHSGLVFFDLVDHEHEMNDRDVLGEIYQDIMQGCQDFRLYYQPIVAANSGEIVGAEALIRWQREPYGLVAPNRFIPYMEQNPCIYEMGNWVLQQALKDAMQMSERLPGFIINVNVAPTQLERKEFAPGVIRMLEETGYPPENLCLELTERCRELDFEFLRQQIEFFRSHGIRVAMDDFGTGHAALQLVLELPIDEIKIDRNFVQDIQQQKINQVIVSGIAKEAHTLNAEICIEGIEDEELGNYLQQFGPTYYQGYYYSKPVAKEDFLALLA